MTRTRSCDSPAPANGGDTCPGDRSQSEGCDPCPQGMENIMNILIGKIIFVHLFIIICIFFLVEKFLYT